jgi:hypothetical protein
MEMKRETPELIVLWLVFCLWFAFFLSTFP